MTLDNRCQTLLSIRWERHSSQHEIIYLKAGDFYAANDIVSHELGHLLHWGRDHSPEPIENPVTFWEDAWIDEQFSTFAEIYLTEDLFEPDVNYWSFASVEPDNPLIYFSISIDYNKVRLFMLYMFEHFGNWNYISALINNQFNGIAGIDSTLEYLGYTERFDDAFIQWSIANYIDDPLFEGGKYYYAHYNFDDAYTIANYTEIPTGTESGSLSPYGTDYITFSSAVSNPVYIEFKGDETSKYRLAFVKLNTANDEVVGVDIVTPDSVSYVKYIADDLGNSYDKLVMVAMNIDSALGESDKANYTYSASIYTGLSELTVQNKISIFPNPASQSLSLTIPYDMNGSYIRIYDVNGQIVHSSFTKNTRNYLNINNLNNGLYYLIIGNNNKILTEKFIKQ